ncbi:MAG: WD40 repeat domain-containing protein [Chloroherpetonaceae bacterium]|nr:WD40 repeat domain-containing protein [Chthonomonadaceae bacterium]MDW8208070.1 WD40 repeat domain-containing protein [Chloroherpetonaceae bacterium]
MKDRIGLSFRRSSVGMAVLVLCALSPLQTRAQPAPALPEVLSAGEDHAIKRWDRQGKLATVIGAHDGPVTGIALLPGNPGMTLVSAGRDGKLKIWNVPGARPTLAQDAGAPVLALAVSPDGRTIATAGDDRRIRLWNASDGKELASLDAHADAIRALQFASSEVLVSASADRTLRVWRVTRAGAMPLEYRSNIVAHDRPVAAIAIAPGGRSIASVSEDAFLKTWQIDDGSLKHRIRAGDGGVLAVAFSSDGRTIATGDESGRIRLWDAEKGRETTVFPAGHERAVTALAFSPDGRILISGGEDRTLRYWNATSGQLLMKVEAHLGTVRAIVILP